METRKAQPDSASALMPVEWLLIFSAVGIWLLYQYFRLPMPGQPGGGNRYGPLPFYLKQIYASLYLYALMFVGVSFFHLAKGGLDAFRGIRTWSTTGFFEAIGRRFALRQFFIDARLLHAVVLMFVEFQLLKHLIPHVNPLLFDSEFAAADTLICGKLCGEVLFSWLGSRGAHAASSHYNWYFPYMIGIVLLVLSTCTRRIQHQYVLSFVLLFLVGMVWVFLVPTLGPAFYYPELFTFMKETESGLLQSDLWGMKEALAANPNTPGAVFSISGFPSLHIAVVLLGSMYTFRIHPWLGLTSFSFLLLTFNSTLLLGWHYLLDDVGSILLVVVCVWISRRFDWGTDDSVAFSATTRGLHLQPPSAGVGAKEDSEGHRG